MTWEFKVDSGIIIVHNSTTGNGPRKKKKRIFWLNGRVIFNNSPALEHNNPQSQKNNSDYELKSIDDTKGNKNKGKVDNIHASKNQNSDFDKAKKMESSQKELVVKDLKLNFNDVNLD